MPQFRFTEWGVTAKLVTADYVYFTHHHVIFANYAKPETPDVPRIVLGLVATKVHEITQIDNETVGEGIFSPSRTSIPDLQETQ